MWGSSEQPVTQNSTHSCASSGILKMFFLGLFTQLSNPKTAIVFGSAFAAFLPKEIPEFSYYFIIASAFIIDTTWYALVATLLSTSKAQITYSKFKKYICRVASGFMGLMGLKLLSSQQLP